jgi:hypothetical protein
MDELVYCVVVVGSICSSYGKAIYSVIDCCNNSIQIGLINQVYVKDSCLEELHQSFDAKGYRIELSQTSTNSGEAFASSVGLLNYLRAKLWSGLFIINGVLTEGFS